VTPVAPEPLADLIARLDDAEHALVALGIPRCPACTLLPTSLAAVAAARPDLPLGIALLATPGDWAAREELLWPRGIHVSRSSVPALTLLERGRAVASRTGGAPAHVIDAWLAERLGPAARPVPPGETAEERAALGALAARRAQQTVVKSRRAAD
jgi:hypothetical protein